MTTLIRRGALFGLLISMLAGGRVAAEDITVPDGNTYSVAFEEMRANDPVAGQYTWVYHISEVAGKDLSHVVIELCVAESAVVSTGWSDLDAANSVTKTEFTDPDSNTGLVGVKWEVTDAFKSGTFTFTLDADYSSALVSVAAAKTGGGRDAVGFGFIEGPNCDQACIVSPPVWDGNFDTNETDHYGWFTVQTPNGFNEIQVLLDKSQNIGLMDVYESANGDMGSDIRFLSPLSVDFTTRDAYAGIQYTGPDVVEEVTVNVTPLVAEGSRFMFRLVDLENCAVEVDPVVDFGVPGNYALRQNYPNPANPQTTILFDVPRSTNLRLTIYDVTGRSVKTLAAGAFAAGRHEVVWDGRTSSGERAATGMYFYRLEAAGFTLTRQLMLVK